MKILTFFLLFLNFSIYSQTVTSVYPTADYDEELETTIDSSIVVISPIPFTVSYLIEFNKDTYVGTVSIDRLIDNISLYVYINGTWQSIPLINPQTFKVDKTVRYILLKYKEDCKKVMLLIE